MSPSFNSDGPLLVFTANNDVPMRHIIKNTGKFMPPLYDTDSRRFYVIVYPKAFEFT